MPKQDRNRFVPGAVGHELEPRRALSGAGPEYYPEDAWFPPPAAVQPDPPPPPPAPVQQVDPLAPAPGPQIVDPFEDPWAPSGDGSLPGGPDPPKSIPDIPPDTGWAFTQPDPVLDDPVVWEDAVA